MPANYLEINLETPPASPVLLSLDDLASPEPISLKRSVATLYTVISPQKRPRRAHKTSKKCREKHTTDSCGTIADLDFEWPQCEDTTTVGDSVNDQTTALTAGLPPELYGASTNATLGSHAEEAQSDEYYAYAEAVLNFVTGLFQVSSTLFIVQGWDKKRESATVRVQQYITIGCRSCYQFCNRHYGIIWNAWYWRMIPL